jgi:small GTP-binding protein
MLKGILDDTRKRLVHDLRQKLGEVRVALVRSDADEEHQKALGRAIGQLDDLFLLVVVGEFNAGKSAVINALMGERVLEEGVTPTTSRIQLLRYGAERTRTQRGGDYEELTLPVAILRETCVVDTPGTNAVVRGHEALTREFVPRSDLVLFVTSADRPFTETERVFLESIRDWGKKVVVAVNKTDILENPDDVRTVVEFVREKLRELLGLRPEVFPVSARQASKAKAEGMAPDPRANGFGALEAYLTRTLDDAERLRVKLQSPLGVAERVLDQTSDAVKARLAAIHDDEAALKEVESLRVQQLADVTRDLRLRLAEAERPLVELEKRGDAHLEQALRTGAALGLLDGSRTAAAFRQEVLLGLGAAADKRAEGVVEAIVTGEARLWPAVVERLERRRAVHGARFPEMATAPASDRARLVQALARDCHRALDGFDAAGESARLGAAGRTAAWATLWLAAAALLAAGLGLARAPTTGAALPWLGGALALGAAALLPLGTLRARERRRFAEAASGLRQRFVAALRSGFERELEASQKRVQDSIAPFGRHVRAEGERVRGQAYEVAARRKDVDALRAQVAALR